MNDEAIRLVTIGRILRRRWRLLSVLAVLGALVGYGASVLFPPRYTTSASVLLPGAWQDRELMTQAQIATSSVVLDKAAATLGWAGVDGTDLLERVTATAADGNIVKISGTAETPERAQQLSDQVAQQFVAFAARIRGDGGTTPEAAQPQALKQLVAQASRRITELADAANPGQTVESVQTRTELAKLRSTLQEAVNKLDQVDPAAGRATMIVMGAAARPTTAAAPTRTQLVGAGALAFVLLGVIGHLTAARASRRLRTEPQLAAALGAEILGTVDVPGDRSASRPKGGGPRARIRRLLGTDVPWDLPAPHVSGDEASRRVRYRRVCARLRDQLPGSRQLLLVVPDGDEPARRAAEQLAAEAGGDPALRVVDVPVSRPLVPDRDGESGALVVLSAGSRTEAELGGIAGACADAGHELVGFVVAGPVRPRPKRSTGQPGGTGQPQDTGQPRDTGRPQDTTKAPALAGGTTRGEARGDDE
ncbi:Wzz/FepE/Etk N-terminal domain-containing protein [Kitasatospora sp. NPDC127111]|uniref:Wzz/FepE/Etk N-terminal domain-containing protein n=1 Tax=Kitasatospora sp. NPDC127111 TaxID=3345363 RepID=UPI00362CB7FB